MEQFRIYYIGKRINARRTVSVMRIRHKMTNMEIKEKLVGLCNINSIDAVLSQLPVIDYEFDLLELQDSYQRDLAKESIKHGIQAQRLGKSDELLGKLNRFEF